MAFQGAWSYFFSYTSGTNVVKSACVVLVVMALTLVALYVSYSDWVGSVGSVDLSCRRRSRVRGISLLVLLDLVLAGLIWVCWGLYSGLG